MPTRDLLEVDVFDPDVYANGDPARNGLPNELYAVVEGGCAVCAPSLRDPGAREVSLGALPLRGRVDDVARAGSLLVGERRHHACHPHHGVGGRRQAGHDHHGRDGARPQPASRQSRLYPCGGAQLRDALPSDRGRHRPARRRPGLVRLRRRGGEPIPAPRHLRPVGSARTPIAPRSPVGRTR